MIFIEKNFVLISILLIPGLYLLMAGIFYIVLYRANAFPGKKIQKTNITSLQYKRELRLTISTVFIYSITGLVFGLLYRSGVTFIYFQAGQYSWIYFPVSVLLMVLLHDTYFYWTHRLLHLKHWYEKIHFTHHLSANPDPWTSMAFHPVEAIIQALFFPLVILVIPAHPLALFVFSFYSVFMNVLGHSGFQLFKYKGRSEHWDWWRNSSIHHDHHHLYAKDNYGLYFNFWDRLMKTQGSEGKASEENS